MCDEMIIFAGSEVERFSVGALCLLLCWTVGQRWLMKGLHVREWVGYMCWVCAAV